MCKMKGSYIMQIFKAANGLCNFIILSDSEGSVSYLSTIT